MSPLAPLIVLLLGVGALLAVFFLPRVQFPGPIAIFSVALALAAVLPLAVQFPARAVLSRWGPASLLPLGLMLQVDLLAWLFGLAALMVTLATLLTGLARPGGRRIISRGAMLLLALAGLAALFADNLLTRVMAWAGLDLIYFFVLILLARGQGIEPQSVLNLSFSSAGTLSALGAALLISRTSEALSLRDAVLTAQSTLLITLAAAFRLGLFPLHLGLPTETNIRQGVGTLLRLIPAAVALETVARLSVFGFAEPTRPWLTLFGVGAAVVGAVQLWTADEPRQGLTYLVIAQSGLALLAGLWGGAAALAQQGLALILGGALIFLSNGHDEQHPWASTLPVVGAAALLGLPFTPGFAGVSGLYGGLMAAGSGAPSAWVVLALIVIAQIILAAGMLRAIFWPGQPVEGGQAVRAAYLGGLALPAAGLIVAGVFSNGVGQALGAPPGTPWRLGAGNFAPLMLVLLTAAGGIALWRFEAYPRLRALAEAAGTTLVSLIRLDWLYRLAWGGFRLVSGLFFNLAGVLEGEGAILWTLVAVLLIWLLFSS